jgi:hypothetical protein
MNQFKKIVLQRQQLYNEYIKIINSSLLGLTNKQALVLSKLLELSDTTPINKPLLNKDNRRELLESCSIDECNLSTYLTLFKSKDILVQEGTRWVIYKGIKPIVYNNTMEITFKVNINTDGK